MKINAFFIVLKVLKVKNINYIHHRGLNMKISAKRRLLGSFWFQAVLHQL